MCVKGVELSRVDTKLLLEQYPDIAEIGIPALFLLFEHTSSHAAVSGRSHWWQLDGTLNTINFSCFLSCDHYFGLSYFLYKEEF